MGKWKHSFFLITLLFPVLCMGTKNDNGIGFSSHSGATLHGAVNYKKNTWINFNTGFWKANKVELETLEKEAAKNTGTIRKFSVGFGIDKTFYKGFFVGAGITYTDHNIRFQPTHLVKVSNHGKQYGMRVAFVSLDGSHNGSIPNHNSEGLTEESKTSLAKSFSSTEDGKRIVVAPATFSEAAGSTPGEITEASAPLILKFSTSKFQPVLSTGYSSAFTVENNEINFTVRAGIAIIADHKTKYVSGGLQDSQTSAPQINTTTQKAIESLFNSNKKWEKDNLKKLYYISYGVITPFFSVSFGITF